jgi:hypothetical protein
MASWTSEPRLRGPNWSATRLRAGCGSCSPLAGPLRRRPGRRIAGRRVVRRVGSPRSRWTRRARWTRR